MAVKPIKKSSAPAKKPSTKTLARAADELFTTRQERLALQKDLEVMKNKEAELTTYLIDNLPLSDATGIAGEIAQARIETDTVPVSEDWDLFFKYVKKTGDFSLLQKRLAVRAVEELWDAGRSVPGVKKFTFKKVLLTRVK